MAIDRNFEFSVIVPVYNVEPYLRKCLDSIVNQSYDNYEVIVVDDGSTDLSGKICDEYQNKYSFINVIHQKNGGSAKARNTGLDRANGEWIVFVDSDDWIEVDMLKTLHQYIQSVTADIYSFNIQKIDENGKLIEKLIFSPENNLKIFKSEEEHFKFYFDVLMQYGIGWEVYSKVFNRRIIKEHDIYFVSEREVFAEDFLFVYEYLLYAKSIYLACNIFYNYFQRAGSLMNETDKSTIIPKLLNWAKYGYKQVVAAKLKYFKKNYFKLYFMLLNYHVQFTLSALPKEDLCYSIKSLEKDSFHRRCMNKIRRNLPELNRYLEVYRWV